MKPKHNPPPWLRPRSRTVVGVGWYTQEEWAKVKAHAADPDAFEETYADWVRMAEKALLNLRVAGVVAEKSYVKAEELLAWCLVDGKHIDGPARAQFVAAQERKAGEAGG